VKRAECGGARRGVGMRQGFKRGGGGGGGKRTTPRRLKRVT